MRKFWLVLLAAGAIATLAACSDDGDDTKKPVSPVTEVKVPATGEIGGAFEITGKGFDSSAQISLKSTSGTETAVEELEVSATSAKFNIPSTLTAGIYTVVLKQNGSWELGAVRLSEAEMPILNLGLPSVIKLNKPLEINGIGFTSASKIFLETADAAKTRTELTTTLGSSGVNCTIHSSVKAGAYNVVLKHNNIDWTLGEKIEAAVYKRFMGYKVTAADTYEELTPALIKKLIATMMGMTEADVTDEFIEAYTPTLQGMFASGESTQRMMKKFDSEGRVTAMQLQKDEAAAEDYYTFAYENNKITATNSKFEPGYDKIKTIIWTVADGLITNSEVQSNNLNNYTWGYDNVGHHVTINKGSAVYRQFVYVDNNFTGVVADVPTTIFEYLQASSKNNIFAVDVAQLLIMAANELQNYAGIEPTKQPASYLGLDGKASVNLPSAFLTVREDAAPMPLTYAFDEDGYATSVKWASSGMDPLFGIVSYENSTAVEFIYE